MDSNALYIKVYQDILDGIRRSEYVENTPLPSERYLCEKYHVSRSTIRQSLNKLKENGFVYTIAGNGTFIKPQVFEQPLTNFYSFTDELKRSNILINNEIIEYKLIQIDKSLAEKLSYPVRTTFHMLVRLRSAKDYPIMLETTYLPKERFHHINIEYLKNQGSLYTYLHDKYDFHAERATETFYPILASRHERELLKIPANIPCTLLERYSYEENSIIEYTYSVVRGDKYIFKVDLNNSHAK